MTCKLIEEYAKLGLKVNLSRTEYVCIEGNQQDLLFDTKKHINNAMSTKKLGIKFSQNGTLEETTQERTIQGRKATDIVINVTKSSLKRTKSNIKHYLKYWIMFVIT